jgi:hypothetical protein
MPLDLRGSARHQLQAKLGRSAIDGEGRSATRVAAPRPHRSASRRRSTLKNERLVSRASLVTIVALAAMAPAIAQAETQTVVSSEANALCINPTPGFEPIIGGKPNYAPLTTPHKGPFRVIGKSCAPETLHHPVAMAGPGEAAPPYTGSISGASWVSINKEGSDSSNPAPKYYIYDATFIPCANQVASAQVTVNLFAGNTAGAFLNGVPIGHQEFGPSADSKNFDSPPGPAGGWPFTSAVGPPAGFKVGKNKLQFVVLDESGEESAPNNTGLDFRAAVASVACVPHWYSNGKLIKEGEAVPIAITGTLRLQTSRSSTKCTVKGQDTITNPVGDGAGTGEIKELTFSNCVGRPSPCPAGTTTEVVAPNLPLATHLAPGANVTPITNVIEGSLIEIRCSDTPLGAFTGTHIDIVGRCRVPEFQNEPADSVFDLCLIKQIDSTSGEELTISGVENTQGPLGDEKITAD